MNAKRAFRWAGFAVLGSFVAALVGLGLVGAGLTVGIIAGYQAVFQGGASVSAAASTAAPGLVLAFLGLVVWGFGTTASFYWTLTGAIEEEMRERFDSEMVKSEILSVLDDRLADMQMDVQSVNRSIRELKEDADEPFQYD
ncbi:hypothetical protein ACFQH6_05510 [Halobacteriaceae archaeon GCM10025711]